MTPLWQKNEFFEFAGFGTGASFSNLIHFSAANVDYMVIGRYPVQQHWDYIHVHII